MKLPFVSRAMHEARIESYHADLNRAIGYVDDAREQSRTYKALWESEREANARAGAKFDALLEKYHALRVSGANAKESLPPATRPSLPGDQAIEAAVEQRGGGNQLRRILQHFVHQQRMAKVKEDEIADRVLNWRTNDDEDDVN